MAVGEDPTRTGGDTGLAAGIISFEVRGIMNTHEDLEIGSAAVRDL